MTAESDGKPQWLLLLPCPPTELTIQSLKVAYGPTLRETLRDASEQSLRSKAATVLDVGLACDVSWTRSTSYRKHLFSLLYKLSCVICVDLHIDVLYDNDVDLRYFLFSRESNKHAEKTSPSESGLENDVKNLAQCNRPWTRVLSVQSESCESVLQQFLHCREELLERSDRQIKVSRLSGGISATIAGDCTLQNANWTNDAIVQHASVAVGGTFDHLHAGHKLLLTVTALACTTKPQNNNILPRLTIGITGDALLKEKQYKDHLEDWHQRQDSVKSFLGDFLLLCAPHYNLRSTKVCTGANGRDIIDFFDPGLEIRYVEIFDPFGPTITDPNITALVLSAETRSGGEAVNKRRQERGWQPLEVVEIGVLDAENEADNGATDVKVQDFHHKLSSTQIRSRIHHKLTA